MNRVSFQNQSIDRIRKLLDLLTEHHTVLK